MFALTCTIGNKAMKELNDILKVIALLLLSPLIGIVASIFSLLFFVALPIWIAWQVFLEKFLKREHVIHERLTP